MDIVNGGIVLSTVEKAMKHLQLIIILALTISACKQTPTPLTGSLAVFNWLQQADLEQDINTAIAKQDYRLIAIAGRGKALPGIDATKAQRLKKQCKTKFIQGLGDNKGKGEYRQWWQKAFEYAKQYNQALSDYCLS